jgi:hypothetical protein
MVRYTYNEGENNMDNKTVKVTKKAIVTRTYLAVDGKQFDNRNECLKYERKLQTVTNIKNALATVFDNHEDVYESLVDGLQKMTEEDRKTVLNGLINLSIDRKTPVRKSKTVEAETSEDEVVGVA